MEEGEFVGVVVNELALMDGDVLAGIVGEEGWVLGAVGGFFLGKGGGCGVVGLGFGEGNGRFENVGEGEVAAAGEFADALVEGLGDGDGDLFLHGVILAENGRFVGGGVDEGNGRF